MPHLRTAQPDDPAAWVLLSGLTEQEAADLTSPRGVLVLVVHGSETLAGGALVPLADGVAEIRRMWTAPAHRGRGYARLVLASLEGHAHELGYRLLRLQVDAGETPAITLYRSAGYQPAPPEGRYPLSLDLEKWLVSDPEGRIPVRTAFEAWPDVAA
jgi:GNAT superfamily N-acetyltransferase